MTTYNTGNPLGSVDPRDLYDNAENLDFAVNSDAALTWVDRFGRERKTVHAVEQSAPIASDAADRAVAAADRAEDARDAAQAIAGSAGAFTAPTIASAIANGLDATTPGDTFTATGDDVNYIGIYRNDAGVATEIARMATNGAYLEVREEVDDLTAIVDAPIFTGAFYPHDNPATADFVFIAVDQNSYFLFGVKQDGSFETLNPSRSVATFFKQPSELGVSVVMTDEGFYALLGWDEEGNVVIGGGASGPEVEQLRSEVAQLTIQVADKVGQAQLAAEVGPLAADLQALDTKVDGLADAMALAGGPYLSVSAGLAATTDGDIFAVTEPDSPTFQSLYRNDAGLATLINATQAVRNLPVRFEATPEGAVYVDNGNALTVRPPYDAYYTTNPRTLLPDYAAVVALWDQLVGAHPGIVAKSSFGVASNGDPLYTYTFEPPPLAYYNGPVVAEHVPTLLLNLGIHGNEWQHIVSAWLMMRDMLGAWQNDSILTKMRHRMRFVVVPCFNPYGISQTSAGGSVQRRNANGVDLNRNFPNAWATGGSTNPSADNYRGPSPASEAETQAYLQLLTDLAPDFTLEVHNGPLLQPGDGHMIWLGAQDSDALIACSQTLRELVAFAQKEFADEVPDGNAFELGRLSGVTDGGVSKTVTLDYGIPSILLELPYHLKTNWPRTTRYNRRAFMTIINHAFEQFLKQGA